MRVCAGRALAVRRRPIERLRLHIQGPARVEKPAEIGANLAQVFLLDAGGSGDAVFFKSSVVDAGGIHRPDDTVGDQEQGNGQDK